MVSLDRVCIYKNSEDNFSGYNGGHLSGLRNLFYFPVRSRPEESGEGKWLRDRDPPTNVSDTTRREKFKDEKGTWSG